MSGNESLVTVEIGRRAEQVAAEYLVRQGFYIAARNWRQRDCEIDIVARRGDTMFFVEVKYRLTNEAGSGIEYITAAKLRQMAYAARRWVHDQQWRGEYALAAIEISGPGYAVTQFVDDIF